MLEISNRGTIPVPTRDARTKELTDNIVNFPLGDELINQSNRYMAGGRVAASTALRRFVKQEGLEFRDLISTLLDGEELGKIRVERFLTNTGLKPLFSPIVEDGLRLGLSRNAAAWQDLVARSVTVDRLTYEYYEFENGVPGTPSPTGTGEFQLRRIGQGAPIPTARVTVSTKSYTLFKRGRGIEWTDESKMAPIDLASMWFQQVGIQLSWDYHDEIVDGLLNGYFADGSDDAPVLATLAPGVITDADLYTAQGVMQTQYGYTATLMLMSLTRAVAIRTAENGAGQRLFPGGVEAAGLPPIRISPTVPNDKVIFVDTAFAMLRLVNKEFGTEFDRSVQTQTEGSYGTSIEVTVPLFKNARILLDA